MRIVIEGYPYHEDRLRKIVPERLLDFPDKNGIIRPSLVGYCFNPAINDCIFFLPKVILTKDSGDEDKDLVLNRYDPIALLDADSPAVDLADKSFLRQFSIWIYRAINLFQRNNNTSIVSRQTLSDVDASAKTKAGTIIDTILSLIRFSRDNKDFVIFEINNIHSGYNKINWRKTISRQTPVMQRKSPLYLNPVNKRKQIDFDEELFVIYFSILEYIHRHYGFAADINCNYDTIRGARFEHYLKGFGKARLRQIKYKYFSDKALKLWSLCYTFFDNSERLHSSRNCEDFLVARNFEKVFEAIVEALLGAETPAGFKDQKDGKIIDHIYPYKALINPAQNIYHIADSKYYKVCSPIDAKSIYKQFTYARNVIQLTIDILLGKGTYEAKKKKGYLPYRDKLTEGYNITPNFFISAKIESERSGLRYSYCSDNLAPHDVDKDGNPLLKQRSMQFENRLFDRDTLLLSHYDINFLYLIALYGKGNRFEQVTFRNHARKLFRNYIITLLDRYYEFYIVNPSPLTIDNFVEANFRELTGKLFHYDNILILALEKDHPETTTLTAKYRPLLSPFTLT